LLTFLVYKEIGRKKLKLTIIVIQMHIIVMAKCDTEVNTL